MSALFDVYVYKPILWLLVFIYNNFSFHDLGLAIIILTIVIRVVLLPIFYKSAKDQSLMQKIQPKIKKIQEDFKENKEAQAKAMMELYKENKLNPFSGFFMLLIQLPIFVALFQIFSRELSGVTFDNMMLFGVLNLKEGSLIIAVVAAATQYFQGKISLPKQTKGNENPFTRAGKAMIYIGPAISLVILSKLPAALGFYWIISTLFSIAQQLYINKKILEKK